MAIELRVGAIAKQQGFTIKSLAERAGVAYNTAHSVCTGRATRIDLDTLDRLCGALDVSPGELLDRSVPEELKQFAQTREGAYESDDEQMARSNEHGASRSR